MHGQENYKTQVGQGPYMSPPAFQQRPGPAPAPAPAPAPVTPLTFHHGPLETQPQVIRPGNPSFPIPPGSVPYIHVLSGTSHQSPDTSGMNSGQSYLIHPHFPQTQGSTQSSHSYPTYGPQRFAWSQNVHQIPPTGPLATPRAYPPPSSQGYPMERGLLLQPPSQHAPPPPPPPYSSSSSFSTTDSFGSSVHSATQHSYVHSMGPLPPPPPPPPLPPPPLPPSSPPGVPPLPPSSPPSDNLSNNDGSRNSKEDLLESSNLMLKCHPLRMKPAKDRSVHDVDFTCQSTEIGPEVETITHSPADSDMDMEDDITQPDEEKQRLLSKNFNDECITLSKDVAKEQLQASQYSGGQRLPKVVLDGSLLNAGSLVSQDQRLGSEIPSTCDPVTGRVHSESNHSETSGAKLINQLGGANPFKHLQGYASDDSSDNEVDKLLGDVSHPSVKVGSMNFSAEKGCSFVSELESSKPVPSKSMIETSRIANEDDGKACFATGKAEEFADKNLGDQESVRDVTYTALQSKNSRSCGVDIDLEGGNFQKPGIKSDHAKLNVDEFGRLVREGASDSDTSDTPRYTRRHGRRGRKRSRSQSRSHSPRDRRRSPSRRKERRHQSRSLSPKRQRSRSKSPISRRGSEFIGDRLRREKGQLPECFDFLRGKCYRGATCRYLHQSDKGERLRYNRGKQQYQDMPPTSRSSDFHADRISGKKSGFENKEAKDKGPKLLQDMPGVEELKIAEELPLDLTSHFSDKLNYLQSASPLVADAVARNLSSDSSHDMATGNENSLIQESPAKISDKKPQLVHQQSKQMADSLISESSSLVPTSAVISAHLPADKPDKEEDPIGQPYSVRSPTTKSYSVEEVPSRSLNSKDFSPSISHHASQLPLSIPPDSQVVSAQLGQGISQDYSLMQSTAQFHLKTENYSPCQAPVSYQYSHIPKPSISSSSFLPPPKPPHTHVTANVATVGHNLLSQQHTQQSLLPPRNGKSSYTSLRPHPSELHMQSQIDEYQACTSAREPDQMPHKMDDIRSSCLLASNKMNQQGGSHVSGEGPGHPEQGMNSLQSFSQALPQSFLMQTPPRRMHASLLGSLPSNSNPSFSHPYLQQDYYGLKYSVADGVSAQLGEPGKLSAPMSRVTPDFIERNHPSCVQDFVGSGISFHFNPYASTFDQPLSSQFSSNALTQVKDTQSITKYGPPLGLISVPVHGHNAGSVSLTNMISSSTSARAAEGVLPRPGSDQYDPLFDSIEPASNSLRSDHQKHEITDDSDDIPKFNGSVKMLNVDCIKLEEAAAVSANDSLEIEEYGETADAEVGAVVNGSPANPHDTTEMSPGEVEIDQVKASGKNKKVKDTRSMKLFKISIATFVKEVLKPSWRQGNMSKEAFKTIVKKTVDKVSSAMKSHRIPKSQAKINHYIDSSRGKLTKLVMGYVDKYVKV